MNEDNLPETTRPIETNFGNEIDDNKKKNILDYKEYNLIYDNDNYILRIEIDEIYIYFNVYKTNNAICNYYTTKYTTRSIINKLKLVSNLHYDLTIILNILDQAYSKKDISINDIDKYNVNLVIKLPVIYNIEINIIKLSKQFLNFNDKCNLLFNELDMLKKININNKKENLEKEKEINNLKEIVKNHENKIKELNQQIEEKNKEIDDIRKSLDNKETMINKKIEGIIINNKNELSNNNKINERINEKDNYIIIEQNNKKLNNENYGNITAERFSELINNKISEIYDLFNYKKNNEYNNKVNHVFIEEPQNLKFKLNMTKTNTINGNNDVFEIYVSHIDNNDYLISPNQNTFNLDLILIKDNKIINSLKGHENDITLVRYFINSVNFNEYLISADINNIVIIWDITKNFEIKHKIDTKYEKIISSCMIVFNHINKNDYIITSTRNSTKNDNSSTKVYSLEDGKFLHDLKSTNDKDILYLLPWYNEKKGRFYVIQFAYRIIIINDLLDGKLFTELTNEPENYHGCGFIFNKNNNEYLVSSTENGYINIYDLKKKKIDSVINTDHCALDYIIQWNYKYIIVTDFGKKSFKIIDLDKKKIIEDIIGENNSPILCIKKLFHPLYGETLLTAGKDGYINLWSK